MALDACIVCSGFLKPIVKQCRISRGACSAHGPLVYIHLAPLLSMSNRYC